VARVLRSPLASPLAQPLHDLGSILFPSSCRLCSGTLLRVTAAPVCDDCLSRLLPSQYNLCVRCGENLSADTFATYGLPDGPRECPTCRLAPPPFVRAASFGEYRDTLRSAVHLLKYEHVTAVAAPLGSLLAQAILSLESDSPTSLTVIAVPLSPSRQRTRGFNQTILLARAALRELHHLRPHWDLQPAHDSLQRSRDTESHFRLTPHQRRANLKNAFSVINPVAIAGRDILLLDDIYTTGATARECTRTLLAAGATSVRVATLARAQVETFTIWRPPPLATIH